jgi:hypothetical protein
MINVDLMNTTKIVRGHLETGPETDYRRNKTGETKDYYVIDDDQPSSTQLCFRILKYLHLESLSCNCSKKMEFCNQTYCLMQCYLRYFKLLYFEFIVIVHYRAVEFAF